MRLRQETVTPARAAEWLARSEELTQRTIRKGKVESLTHAIESGQWVLTHQPIALDPDGRVLDGQHRLTAIVRAGIDVDVLVAWDSDPATFDVIDTGAARSQADTLKIAGFHDTNVLAATCRAVLAYNAVAGTTESFEKANRGLTTADTIAFLEQEHDAAIAAMSLANRVSAALGRYGLRSSIASVPLIFATRKTDVGPSALAEFFERLADGIRLEPYSPILSLRRFFVSETGYARLSTTTRRSTAIAVTIKAVNDYALGRERSVMVWKHGIEPMPLPIKPGTIRAESKARERAAADQEEQDRVADAALDAARDRKGVTARVTGGRKGTRKATA